MDLALELAGLGRRLAHPNPRVGAVVVADGEVVGRGHHRGPGSAHAEVVALRQAGVRAKGGTLYCNLEPCAHFGRTPPCADAVLAAGVTRVVAAMKDPNPLVDGRGFARLRAGGVRVDVLRGATADRAARLNAPFVKATLTGLPWVTYTSAVSLDGKVSAADGKTVVIGGVQSRRMGHAMRAAADAVVIGAGTLRAADPQLTVRLAEGSHPVRVVLTSSGRLAPSARLFADAGTAPVLVLAERGPAGTRAALEALGVEVRLFEGGLDGALRLLAARGLLDVLLEGGPTLASAMLARGLLDHISLFVAPSLVGRDAVDLLTLPAVADLESPPRLTHSVWRQVGDDMLLEADVAVA
jgi:diaminohydroxyphosphoribosylaminopyrimidine deaminase / 5-amino-6-(5-phosphoribosylamino)uracil reductase